LYQKSNTSNDTATTTTTTTTTTTNIYNTIITHIVIVIHDTGIIIKVLMITSMITMITIDNSGSSNQATLQ
jgi:hypothetical protein